MMVQIHVALGNTENQGHGGFQFEHSFTIACNVVWTFGISQHLWLHIGYEAPLAVAWRSLAVTEDPKEVGSLEEGSVHCRVWFGVFQFSHWSCKCLSYSLCLSAFSNASFSHDPVLCIFYKMTPRHSYVIILGWCKSSRGRAFAHNYITNFY